METQIGQLSKRVEVIEKIQLGANIEVNLTEECQATIFESDKVVEEEKIKRDVKEEETEKLSEEREKAVVETKEKKEKKCKNKEEKKKREKEKVEKGE